MDEDHIPIGRIACDIRRGKRKVSPKQWRELDSIGFCGHISKEDYSFEEKMLFLEAYKNEFGDVNVPQKYVTKEGVPLGEIVHLLRQRKTLTQDEVDALNCLGFVWKNHHRSSYSFEEYVNMLEEYYHEHGSYMIKASYKTKEGLPLGQIHYSTLNGHRKITDEQIEVLRKMGLDI